MSMRPTWKQVVDVVANIVKTIEEALTPSPMVILDGFRRSLQLDDYSCGAQSAFAVLQYYGKARSIANVTRDAGTTRDGTNSYQLIDLFKRRGLRPVVLKAPTLGTLKAEIRAGNPVLAYVDDRDEDGNKDDDYGHWVAVYGFGPGSVFVADPTVTRYPWCRHSVERFRKRWAGRWAMAVRESG